MHILQLISGTVFTILTAAGLYMAWSGKNNVFFAAALLFLIIAISCFLLAASRIRKKRKESETDDQPDMTTDADGQSTDGTEAQPSDEEEDNEPSEDPGAAVPDEVEPPAGDEMPDEEDNSPEQEAPDSEALTDEEHENAESSEEETDVPEEEIIDETDDMPDFYKDNRTRLIQMDTEISLMNRRARLTATEISQMTSNELEDAILHTQLAINAFNRMKIFCDANGEEGRKYFDERMQHHTEDPEFLSVEEITRQMDTLKSTFDEKVKEAAESPAPETSEETSE